MSFLELSHISKSFGLVRALSDINLTIEEGKIHAFVGENGAGKSTLAKIICGVLSHDSGNMQLMGRTVNYGSPREAIFDGISAIQQELTVVPALTVIQNVYLGLEGALFSFPNKRHQKMAYTELCRRSKFELPGDEKVSSLSHADKKKVEILRAIARDAKLIIFDEPTASMGAEDAEKLHKIINDLRDSGTTIIYISHFLKEVLKLSNTITVLRNGNLIKTSPASQETPASLVASMLGKEVNVGFPPKPVIKPKARQVLSVSGLTRAPDFIDISFTINEGEIVGLAGLVGSGRTEIARAVFGIDNYDSGEIRYFGETIKIKNSTEAIKLGIALLPESRKTQGLVMQLPVGNNVTLPHLGSVSKLSWIDGKKEYIQTREILEKLDVRPPIPKVPITSLSGGNQQKTVFAKWLFRSPKLLIADEPTCGVDVNARRGIYSIITSLAEQGMSVLIISSENEEIIGLAHRAYVISHGRISAELQGDNLNEKSIMEAAFSNEEKIN